MIVKHVYKLININRKVFRFRQTLLILFQNNKRVLCFF